MDDYLEFASEPSAQREPQLPAPCLRGVSHVLNLLQHVGVSCFRISTCHTLPCLCVNQRCCVSKLRQLHTPLGQALMCPARSFGSDPHMTNSRRTSATSGRSSASAGTLEQYISILAAKQVKVAEFCIVSPKYFHVSSLVFICSSTSGLVTSNSAIFIRHFLHLDEQFSPNWHGFVTEILVNKNKRRKTGRRRRASSVL